MTPVETTLRRMMEGMNLTKIYCKHSCKCHNVPPVQQLYGDKKVTSSKSGRVREGSC
jgi:hypothetical protein